MEAFMEYMTFVCLAVAVIGLVLGLPCYIMEKIDDHYDGKISTAVCKFFDEDLDEDSEDDFDEE